MRRRRKIDKVRASRDGHEFHEAWAARKAMQLLLPDSDLVAIAVEGLSPADQAGASDAMEEVADLTFYHGGNPIFEDSTRTTVTQLKYSIADQNKDFRASHAKITVQKFGEIYRSFKHKHGARAVEDKLYFQLVTNRPIADSLLQAIEATSTGSNPTGDAKEQARQFKTASGLSGNPLAEFARKFKVIGRSGNLQQIKYELASLFVDWSATYDSIAADRLGELRKLVRDKAGYAGTDRNLIRHTDVLAALQVGDPKDLLPCEAALVDVGEILERTQLNEAISRISSMSTPLLIHAAGGVGKTIFMYSLASRIATDHEVVFFDCFGGGAYRSPEDARHLPRKGLIHIANTLAFRGFCDPILPNSPDVQTLLGTFRRRLTQCLDIISRMTPGRKLAIFIDAIDNAAYAAAQTSEDSFPIKLLESLDTNPIDGVKLIVSCRSETERRPKTYAKFDEFQLYPFTKDETSVFLCARLEGVTSVEVDVAQARSGGNPRVLDYLVKEDRGLLDPSEIENRIELDDLIQERISVALSLARMKGYEEKDLNALLAGLAVLPPPVPMDEYASALGMELEAIESFASDLSPLLERTNHGLMFRDEPTETLIHTRYATPHDALEDVAFNLLACQDVSVYAARALPRLLHELDDGEQLFALAFDDRIPASITSTVGKRNIQYARLKAASFHAALKVDYNSLVRLLVELSTIAQVDQRGADYLLEHPDLVVAAGDDDARRRLFEIRTAWPGTRHACLTIVNILSGDPEEATRHAYANEDWIQHFRRKERKEIDREPIPGQVDIAATIFFLISKDRPFDAARYLTGWHHWYAFEVSQLVLGFTHLAELLETQAAHLTSQFIDALTSIGSLAAALSFHEIKDPRRKLLCRKLAALCKKETKLYFPHSYVRPKNYELENGLRKSAAIALSLGLGTEAQSISLRARHDRPGVWAYRDIFNRADIFSYIFRVALLAAARKRTIHEKDLLPKELKPICTRIPKIISGKQFQVKAKEKLSKLPRKPDYDDKELGNVPANAISHGERQAAERFLNIRLEPLLALTEAFSVALAASVETIDNRFVELVEVWEQARKTSGQNRNQDNDPFFHFLGLDTVFFILWSRRELKPESIKRMLEAVHAHMCNASDLVRIIEILAQRNSLHTIAGEQAVKARGMIEQEDDVTYRASLYGALGRAIFPASLDEAAIYFRDGLEQMDAIGSGDYLFTNELLLFASAMKGNELEEQEFHTLSNICELNIGEESDRFFWGAYGRGMAKVAGLRGLAKLSRWDDRNGATLDNTLQTYLTGLLEAGKIDPYGALCLNRLADPVEYYYAGTKEFAEALCDQAGTDAGLVTELITQFKDNNPTMASDDTLEKLCEFAEVALGASHDLTKHLTVARGGYDNARQGWNNAHGSSSLGPKEIKEAAKRDDANREELANIAEKTDPTDEASLLKAIDEFNALGNMYDLKSGFFSALRDKVPFAARCKYVHNIARLEHLFFYWKFAELQDAKEAWIGSSAALEAVYRDLAKPLILAHADDLVKNDRLSGSNIKKISEFTGVPMAELVLEAIKVFSRSDNNLAGSTWLAFANLICPVAEKGHGQLALKRILTSDSAKLADSVKDGPWMADCYPANNFPEIAAGLIWRVLGSPHAVDRWRAAHCIRSFAKFGRWDIIDEVVAAFDTNTAKSFQAPELDFYYLHARLWLLISMARIAIDHPDQVMRYKGLFLDIILEKDEPHVLMRHFAAKALLACVDQGQLAFDEAMLSIVRNVDKSPHSRLPKKIRNRSGFYLGRPNSVPKPSYCFHLEYNFEKIDVDSLGRVFGKNCWEVNDLIAGIVHRIDPSVTYMSEEGGRERHRRSSYESVPRFQGYGEQLGWHALFIAAGNLLAAHPVTDDWSYEEDPWKEWLGRYKLTRKDGLWLSDGTDRTPDDASVSLLESKNKSHAITGDQKKIMGLAGLDIEIGVGEELVVQGRWFSSDGIRIGISSALALPQKATQLARKLIREEPMQVWVPCLQVSEDDDEYQLNNKRGFTPWIVFPSGESRLDDHDPYGVSVANLRPRLAKDYLDLCKLKRQDAFGNFWNNHHGTCSLRAQAWGRDETNRESGPHPGLRLLCKSNVLKKVLTKYDKELLLLFELERYEKETYRGSGQYSHSISVVRIDKALNVEYFKGRVNYPNKF